MANVNTHLSPTETEKNFAANVRYRRLRLGLTQQGLADRMGISCYRISEIERCRYSPTLGLVDRIARALKTTPDTLILPHEQALADFDAVRG